LHQLKNELTSIRGVGYLIDDPREMAGQNPYTFFLPQPYLIDQLREGDLVKMAFIANPPVTEWQSERMWVRLTTDAKSNPMIGTLSNHPRNIAGLKLGDTVRFESYCITDLRSDADNLNDPMQYDPTTYPPPREYWEPCTVDDAILDGSLRVEHLERKAPKASDDDTVVDSGWHIWADTHGLTDEEIAARPHSYVALGKVLNQDGSWLHLIDSPEQSSFTRNWQNGEFEKDPIELDKEQ
jgi:hypothetical protein